MDDRFIRQRQIFTLLILFFICSFIVFHGRLSIPGILPENFTTSTVTTSPTAEDKILLLYVYSNTHSHAYGNLKYFIDKSVEENDRVDYYFILQKVDNVEFDLKKMPHLKSSNAHYIQHENQCFDYGTFGWFFSEFTIGNPWKNETSAATKTKIDIRKYKYFIFMNSSIRGPFYPPYYLRMLSQRERYHLHWYSAFTDRITDQVKMVGCTINCETSVHVQSYFIVIDYIALTILLKPGPDGGTSNEGIFYCYPTKFDVIMNSEVPSTNRILNAGYQIDSMMTEYQEWNFSSDHSRLCNDQLNPFVDGRYHGIILEPYEVVFVKFTDQGDLLNSRKRAELYQNWTYINYFRKLKLIKQ